MQKQAASDDKGLNKALGLAISASLESDGIKAEVRTEKRSIGGTTLQPDIQIILSDADIICIEPTWRTTGTGVKIDKSEDYEVAPSQNSLTRGNLQKYLLGKAWDYISALGL